VGELVAKTWSNSTTSFASWPIEDVKKLLWPERHRLTFDGRVVSETTVGNHKAIIPEITGRTWICGTSQMLLHPEDTRQLSNDLTQFWSYQIS
jgi:hypothetical protein